MKTHAVSRSPLAAPPALIAAALLGLAAGSAAPAAAQAPDFEWSGTVAQGRTLEIVGVNGGIEASASPDGRVHVSAVRHARRSNPESVRIEVVEHAGGVTICAVYPTPPDARQENRCDADGSGSSVQDNDVKVDFTVRVPAGVRFTATTVNGGIEAEGLASDVEARTVNGAIAVRTSGRARASTVNGDISARMGTAALQDDLEFSTVNGSIDVAMPASLNADLRVSTLNGTIDTDFDVLVRGSSARRDGRGPAHHRSLRGTIGSGGPDLRLSTVNGGIRLRRL